MRRFLTLLATSVLLWALVAHVNDLLSGFRVYLFAGALFVTFAALAQPFAPGLAAAAAAGLICDANAPVAYGTHLLLFVAAHGIVHHLRERIPADDAVAVTVVTLFANFGLFLVFSFGQLHGSPAPAAVWPRLLVDLLCSQIFLALVTPWFFALQRRALELTRAAAPGAAPRFGPRRL